MTTLLLTIAVLIAALLLWLVKRNPAATLEPRMGALERSLERIEQSVREEIRDSRREMLEGQARVSDVQMRHLDAFARQLSQPLGDQIAGFRAEMHQALQANAQGTAQSVNDMARLSLERVDALAAAQEQQWGGFRMQIEELRSGVEMKVEGLRTVVEQRLKDIQQDTAVKLDQMRQTVDEKLQHTLETRLGESFRQVSERLEQVYKGLGEMQVLATGVGDLKRVLSNVKTRGTWGEVQLAALLQQVLAPDQYEKNFATSTTGSERVEFAIRLPGRSSDSPTWLPIDAKFPLEDFQALNLAMDDADAAAVDEASSRLAGRVRECAKDIGKYINPPLTTDFAIMFLPNEGLYAEVLRRPGLADQLQREHRVVIAGPTTLWAILNSLQMGFRTLAIERRSSEVWALLGAVKTEFGRFGSVLDRVQKNLHHAATKIDEARKGTRAIERKLTDVQELGSAEAAALLDVVAIETTEPALLA